MKGFRAYPLESLLVATAVALTLGGFWNAYIGPEADANAYHHLHALTNLTWLLLLVCQIALIGDGRRATHRTLGLTALVLAPLLVASVTLLSIESARKGVASGRGDFMIVQNVMGTLQLAAIIVLGFALRRNRRLHAAFLVSTALLFLGIALFFSLVGFVPGFKVEGPETFYRFGKALTAIQYACPVIALVFLWKDPRCGWPFLLVGLSFVLNEQLKALLAQQDLIQPLTELVGSIHQPSAFAVSLVATALLLVSTGVLRSREQGSENIRV